MSEFKITGPGRYLTRNGVMAIVEKKIEDASNWTCIGRSEKYFHAWSESGFIYSENSPNDYDIIGPWVEHESGPLGSLDKSYEIARQNGTGKPATGTGAPSNPPSGGSSGHKKIEVLNMTVMTAMGEGVALRDWFAGQALNGLLARGVAGFDPQEIAYQAGKYADAMMAARKKGGAV